MKKTGGRKSRWTVPLSHGIDSGVLVKIVEHCICLTKFVCWQEPMGDILYYYNCISNKKRDEHRHYYYNLLTAEITLKQLPMGYFCTIFDLFTTLLYRQQRLDHILQLEKRFFFTLLRKNRKVGVVGWYLRWSPLSPLASSSASAGLLPVPASPPRVGPQGHHAHLHQLLRGGRHQLWHLVVARRLQVDPPPVRLPDPLPPISWIACQGPTVRMFL